MRIQVVALLAFFAMLNPSKAIGQDSNAGTIRDWNEERVSFWIDVYSKYDSSHSLVHDRKYPHIIYEVLKFDSKSSAESARSQRIQSTKKRYRETLEKLAVGGIRFHDLSPEEWRIYNLFKSIKEKNKYRAAMKRIRIQDGRRDSFIAGLQRSGRYVLGIQRIMQSFGLPVQLVSLVFVESLFYPKAVSKVGAAGLWQLMPATAREFITVNQDVDERFDPFIATVAACKILRRNVDKLDGSWPLALTAYNHGLGGMMRARQRHGTKNLEALIQNYDSDSFKFASKNFYAQYLAAADVFFNSQRYFGDVQVENSIQFEIYPLPFAIMLDEVAKVSQIERNELVALNPSLTSLVVRSKLPLPTGYPLRVPVGQVVRTAKAMRELEEKGGYNMARLKGRVYKPTDVPLGLDWLYSAVPTS